MKNEQPEQILERWLIEYRGLMLRVARSFATVAADEEDLLQEIAVALWNSIPRFRGESRESTWIYRVSLFTATTWSRSIRLSERLMHEDPAQLPDARASAELSPEQRWLAETVRTLPCGDRVLLVSSLEGYSHTEIAEITGLSASNVGVRLHRLRQRLSTMAKEHFDGL